MWAFGSKLKWILAIWLFIQSFNSEAQLAIELEPSVCLYGIKDNQENWVVEPAYRSITRTVSNQYLVRDTLNKLGLLGDYGTVVLPCIYDEIQAVPNSDLLAPKNEESSFTSTGRAVAYIVSSNGKQGIVGMANNPITELDYSEITADKFPHFVAKRTIEGEVYSSHISLKGKNRIDVIKGDLATYNKDSASILKVDSSFFLVGVNGQILSGPYDDINKCSRDRYTCRRNDSLCAIDHWGNIILPMMDIDLTNPAFKYTTRLWKSRLYTYRSDGSFGIIRGNGDTILPPSFDSIIPLSPKTRSKLTHFICLKDGKYGTLNGIGQIMIPAIYDTVIPIQHTVKSSIRDRNSLSLLCRENGNYGLLSQHNELIEPFVNKAYLFYNKSLAFKNWNRLRIYRFPEGEPTVMLLDQSSSIDSLVIFQGMNTIRGIVFRNGGFDIAATKTVTIKPVGNLFILRYKGSRHLIDNAGKVILTRCSLRPEPLSNDYRIIKTRDDKYGVVNITSGQLTITPVYDAFYVPVPDRKLVWLNQKPGDKKEVKREDLTDNWFLFEPTGTLLTTDPFNCPAESGVHGVATMNDATGVFDQSTMTWVLPPKFKCVQPLFEGLWKVKTKNGLWGVVNKNLDVRVDTVFKQLELATYNPNGAGPQFTMVGVQQRKKYQIDESGDKKEIDEAEYTRLKNQLVLSSSNQMASAPKISSLVPMLITSDEEQLPISEFQQQQLAKVLRSHLRQIDDWQPDFGCGCSTLNGLSEALDAKPKLELVYADSTRISVRSSTGNDEDDVTMLNFKYENSKYQNISIRSLQRMNPSLLSTLLEQIRPGDNCSNGVPKIIGFNFTENGVLLEYVGAGDEHAQQAGLTDLIY